MLRKGTAQSLLLVAVLATVVLAQSAHALPYSWSTTPVEPAGPPDYGTSIAVHPNGDILVSYHNAGMLKYAICDVSASGHGNCDQLADWKTTSVDGGGFDSSIAVDGAGDPVISYNQNTSDGVKFAICDMSASTHGNCDQTADWKSVALGGEPNRDHTSITLHAGDPMIAYYQSNSQHLGYAICDMSASTHGDCDDAADWKKVTVDSTVSSGACPSIAVDPAGNVMISHWFAQWAYPSGTEGVKFASCSLPSSTHGNCDEAADWDTGEVDVRADAPVGGWTSLATNANGDPAIAYNGGPPSYVLRFATCDMSQSAHGDCDQTSDWRVANVATPAQTLTNRSIAMAPSGHLLISYYDPTNKDLKLAICRISASAHGNCDQASDWITETVDEAGDVGVSSSVAADSAGRSLISYYDDTNDNLKFAIGSPFAVGGIAELPPLVGTSADEPSAVAEGRSSSAAYYAALAAGVAALLGVGAGAWYARRRWLR